VTRAVSDGRRCLRSPICWAPHLRRLCYTTSDPSIRVGNVSKIGLRSCDHQGKDNTGLISARESPKTLTDLPSVQCKDKEPSTSAQCESSSSSPKLTGRRQVHFLFGHRCCRGCVLGSSSTERTPRLLVITPRREVARGREVITLESLRACYGTCRRLETCNGKDEAFPIGSAS
jgi:hypothetical protein